MNSKVTACALALLMLGLTEAFSQHFTISGVVKDSADHQPIPFAHVTVADLVTVTNLSGEFVLSFDTAPDAAMQVSFIGYHPYRARVIPDQQYEIYLSPSSTVLDEVVVMTGDRLMRKVYNRLPINYEHEAQHIMSYYKEKLMGTNSLYYLAEGILEIYLPSNVSNDPAQVSAVKTRKRVVQPLIQGEVTMVKGHAVDMAESSIWRKSSFLNIKNRDDYEFIYKGRTNYGEEEVYIVEFEPKNSKGYISGKLYIQDDTYAIVRMEYVPDASRAKLWNEIRWVEEFGSFAGTYQLIRSSYEGTWTQAGEQFVYSALLVNNQMKTVKTVPDMGELIGEKDIFYEAADTNFEDSFWETYNFIKLEGSELSVVY